MMFATLIITLLALSSSTCYSNFGGSKVQQGLTNQSDPFLTPNDIRTHQQYFLNVTLIGPQPVLGENEEDEGAYMVSVFHKNEDLANGYDEIGELGILSFILPDTLITSEDPNKKLPPLFFQSYYDTDVEYIWSGYHRLPSKLSLFVLFSGVNMSATESHTRLIVVATNPVFGEFLDIEVVATSTDKSIYKVEIRELTENHHGLTFHVGYEKNLQIAVDLLATSQESQALGRASMMASFLVTDEPMDLCFFRVHDAVSLEYVEEGTPLPYEFFRRLRFEDIYCVNFTQARSLAMGKIGSVKMADIAIGVYVMVASWEDEEEEPWTWEDIVEHKITTYASDGMRARIQDGIEMEWSTPRFAKWGAVEESAARSNFYDEL